MGDPHTHEFFRLLSLCHTVMSEEKSEGAYRASPLSFPDSCCAPLCDGMGHVAKRVPFTPHVIFLPT